MHSDQNPKVLIFEIEPTAISISMNQPNGQNERKKNNNNCYSRYND